MVGQGKWFQWGSKFYDSHELVILASLCAAFSLSGYLKVGHMRVSLCFSLLFSTEIAKPSLSALPGLTVRARLCLRWQMWPQNHAPSLPLSGVRIHPATGALKSVKVDLPCLGAVRCERWRTENRPSLFIFESQEILLLHMILTLKNNGRKYRMRRKGRLRKI